MKVKAIKITYYISTGFISLTMLFSVYAYLTNPEVIQAFQHLGFPDYFRIELAIAKFIGAVLLWVPVRLLKEAAYTGFAINFVSAIIAHICRNDSMFHTVAPLVVLMVLVVSFVSYQKMSGVK